MQVNSRENWLFITKHPKATGHSDNLYRNEQAEQLHTASGTGRREHVDVFLCAPFKSLIFFLSFYVMSLNNLLLSNVKRKLHRRDSSESSSGSPVEKRLKELLSDTPRATPLTTNSKATRFSKCSICLKRWPRKWKKYLVY